MTSVPQLESAIVKKLIANVKKLAQAGEPIAVMKVHGGAFTSGEPDIFICWDGRMVVWEFKNEVGRATKRQEANLEKWRRAGAITGIWRSSTLPLLSLNPSWVTVLGTTEDEKKPKKRGIAASVAPSGGFD
jgi:hypothetical protein